MEKSAIINTKTNYRNLNGTVQDVIEIKDQRVTCSVWVEEFQKKITIDFTKSEVIFAQSNGATIRTPHNSKRHENS